MKINASNCTFKATATTKKCTGNLLQVNSGLLRTIRLFLLDWAKGPSLPAFCLPTQIFLGAYKQVMEALAGPRQLPLQLIFTGNVASDVPFELPWLMANSLDLSPVQVTFMKSGERVERSEGSIARKPTTGSASGPCTRTAIQWSPVQVDGWMCEYNRHQKHVEEWWQTCLPGCMQVRCDAEWSIHRYNYSSIQPSVCGCGPSWESCPHEQGCACTVVSMDTLFRASNFLCALDASLYTRTTSVPDQGSAGLCPTGRRLMEKEKWFVFAQLDADPLLLAY